MISRLRTIYHDYPSQFWLLMTASFIDMMGGSLIFPFFSLFFTQKFNVSLAQVGGVLAVWATAGLVGRTLGGALTDRVGRKRMVIFGLVFSALSSLILAFVDDFRLVFLAAGVAGIFSSMGGPAYHAMIADLLPGEKITDGYGISRVVGNVAFAIGPAIGGLLADINFVLLFVLDAVSSVITALFVARYLSESRTEAAAQETEHQSLLEVLGGYARVLTDTTLLAMIVLGALVGLVYWQWYFSVPVFMRDVHGMPAQYYGWMMSMAGVIVIVFQLAITRKLRGVGQHWVMAAGSVLFGIGFGMFGFISAYAMFLLASTVITFGEMVLFPTQQAIVARLAPEALRGRYIAAAGLAFALPNIFGPYLGGLALESVGPQSMWYLGALMCLVGTLGYLPLRGRLARAGDSSPE